MRLSAPPYAEMSQTPNRLFSVKVLGNSDEGLEVLHREIDLLAELDHPNICRLYEAFQDLLDLLLSGATV